MILVKMPFLAFMGGCLILTIVIEMLGAFLLGVRKKQLWYVLLAQIMTNPLVVSVPIYAGFKYGWAAQLCTLIFFEIFAVVSEAILYKKTIQNLKIKPIPFSLILNIASYFIGFFIELFVKIIYVF